MIRNFVNTQELLTSQLKQWDSWIREGQSSKVKQLCLNLNAKTIPRELLVEYAHIARRVGNPELVIRWLCPFVRAEKTQIHLQPSVQEKALYALGLARLGAFREAGQILQKIPGDNDPLVHFYRGSLFIDQWSYKKAVPELKKYIQHPQTASYMQLVARLNLCTSLLYIQNFKKAEIEISRLMKKLEKGNFSLLKGNLLEIRSQFFCAQGQYKNALSDLEEASLLLRHADKRTQLYVDKWKVIIRTKMAVISRKSNADAIKSFQALKRRALRIKDWETIRDCDLNLALHLKDESLVLRVYWGSLFPEYKKRVLSFFGKDLVVKKDYLWVESEKAEMPMSQELVRSSAIDLVHEAPTPILKHFFFLMTREFYRPLRVTELIDSLYPNEFYNPVSSPLRLNRVIERARQWLKKMSYPIEISAVRNAFKLKLEKSCVLLIKKEFSPDVDVILPESFRNRKMFTTQDWAREFDLPSRTARRQVQQLLKAGQIKGHFRGPKTIYKCCK